jgi:hypothetical protein
MASPRSDDEHISRWETDGGHVREPAPAAGTAQADHVRQQLDAVADRLCREFAPAGGPADAAIRQQVRQARAAYGSPRVIAYLPVLIERAIRRSISQIHTAHVR